MKITKSHLKQFIREELEAALKEYITNDPEAQKVLNHLNYQQRKALEQMMTMMGVEAAEFDELLRNPGKLAQFLELMQQASQVQVAEGHDAEVLVKGYGQLTIEQIQNKLIRMIQEAAEDVQKDTPGFTHFNSGVMMALYETLKEHGAV